MEPGTVLAGRYRLERLLRRSTIGEVFFATHLGTGKGVEIKLIGASSAELLAGLRREAEAGATVPGEHVQRVIGIDEDKEGGPLLVQEWMEGESLLDRLKSRGPLPFAEIHPLIEQVWLGLISLHTRGVIHRDLKPDNVFIGRSDDGSPWVKLRGLGLCKIAGREDDVARMGQSPGAFSYMPPEQIGKAKTVDHRADIYACSTIVFQALTGQLPYSARNVLVMVELKAKTDARRLGEAMASPVDPRLEAFVARGLARNPAQRFSSAGEALAGWWSLRRSHK